MAEVVKPCPDLPAAEQMALLHLGQIDVHIQYMIREVGHDRAMELLAQFGFGTPRPSA
jgi:hypothetical protein